MTFGFYAVIGGFVVDVGHIHNRLTRVTLAPTGVATLAREGHFISISKNSIKDKSKADTFAKALVIFQVTWMTVQCVARKITGKPLTLLKVHTFVHAVCALMMYTLWLPVSLGDDLDYISSTFDRCKFR